MRPPSGPYRETIQVLAERARGSLRANREFDLRHNSPSKTMIIMKPVFHRCRVRAVQFQGSDTMTSEFRTGGARFSDGAGYGRPRGDLQ
jgi:hypothetical protein